MGERTAKQRLGAVLRERMRARREALGITQAQLASLLRCHPSLIAHFESGARLPSLPNLSRLADALMTSTDWLLGRVALLCLALLGCAADHGQPQRIEGPPLYVHLCDAMPAADAYAWGTAAGDINLERGEPVLWVGHGEPEGCSTVDVCFGQRAAARDDGCVITIRYVPGSAQDVARHELESALRRWL